MPGNILGESNIYSQNGFTGVNLNSGGTVVYRNPRRGTGHGGSGPGSADFAAQDPRRVDLNNGPIRDTGDVPPGGDPIPDSPVTNVTNITVNDEGNVTSSDSGTDMRVRIRVPSNYITDLTQGTSYSELGGSNLGGIIFPYTPQITMEHKADYTSQNPIHSNYTINFYKGSSVSDITITGKFTVQNETDAIIWLSTIRLLASLTKMKFGPDGDAGTPPPICRLDAYGEYMLKNVPVAITSFKHDLPDQVDFYTLSESSQPFGAASVPTSATLTVILKPMYSRAEMQQISVAGYLNGSFKGRGFL